MQKVFSVEDNPDISELLKYSLTSFGFDITLFETAEELFEFLSESELPDIILLDIMLPKMSGIEALKKLKRTPRTAKIPVIMLTAKSSEMNIVQGLEEGADDYVTKPFSVIELSARIKANIRRVESLHLKPEDLKINRESHEVTLFEKNINLTLKEYELLCRLADTPDTVVERETLLSEVWGYEYLGETRTLDMHIRTLRGKMGDAAGRIITVRGVGYMLKSN